jgi:colanic acid biosynthesis glycosyl transferase WcaI
MNFMAYGLPVLALVKPGSEVARIVEQSGGGWVVDSGNPALFPRKLAALIERPDEIRARAAAALRYAQDHFSVSTFTEHFESVLREVVPPTQEPGCYS